MQRDLKLLLELQEIDEQLAELESSKVYLPDMINNLEREISGCKQEVEDLEQGLVSLERERKRLELEIDVNQEELARSRKRMREIKTNKEYDALTAQISHVKDKISENEEALIQVLEQLEVTAGQLKEVQEKCGGMEKSHLSQLGGLRGELDSIEDKIKSRQTQRRNVASHVSRRVMSVYERVRRGKRGAAVVMIKKRSCGGCFKQVPPQRIQEIKKGDRIYACDNCGRILVWSEEEQ
jgi:predicted  nucleic acid-binding Zn-ribbon protein